MEPISEKEDTRSIFLSYRRQFASFEARAVYQHLRSKDFDAFLDVEDIDSGRFENVILNRLGRSRHVVLILTPETLSEMTHVNDWVRRETERALELGKNIVPLLFHGATLPRTDAQDDLFNRLSQVNALEVPPRFFDAAMQQLVSRFLTQPTLQELQVKIAEEHFQAAEEARAKPDLPLALREYSQAITKNPRRPEYFCNRSAVYLSLNQFNEALDDVNQALALDPTSSQLRDNKFYILQAMGDTQAALDWLKAWGVRTGTWAHDLPTG